MGLRDIIFSAEKLERLTEVQVAPSLPLLEPEAPALAPSPPAPAGPLSPREHFAARMRGEPVEIEAPSVVVPKKKDKEEVPESEVRVAILEAVTGVPGGLKTGDLQGLVAIRTGANAAQIRKAMGQMVLDGKLISERIKGQRGMFWRLPGVPITLLEPEVPEPEPEEPEIEEGPPEIPAEQIDAAIKQILGTPGVTTLITRQVQEQVADAIDVGKSRVRIRMKALEKAGTIKRVPGVGRGVNWSLGMPVALPPRMVVPPPLPPPPALPGEITDERMQELREMGDIELLEVSENLEARYNRQEQTVAKMIIGRDRLVEVPGERFDEIRAMAEADLAVLWYDEDYPLGERVLARDALRKFGADVSLTYEGVDVREIVVDILQTVPTPVFTSKIQELVRKHSSRGKITGRNIDRYVREVLEKLTRLRVLEDVARTGERPRYQFTSPETEVVDASALFEPVELPEAPLQPVVPETMADYEASLEDEYGIISQLTEIVDALRQRGDEIQQRIYGLKSRSEQTEDVRRRTRELETDLKQIEENIQDAAERRVKTRGRLTTLKKARLLQAEQLEVRLTQMMFDREQREEGKKPALSVAESATESTEYGVVQQQLAEWTDLGNQQRAARAMQDLGLRLDVDQGRVWLPDGREVTEAAFDVMAKVEDVGALFNPRKPLEEEVERGKSIHHGLRNDLRRLEQMYHILIYYYPDFGITTEIAEGVPIGALAYRPGPGAEPQPIRLSLGKAQAYAEGQFEALEPLSAAEEERLYDADRDFKFIYDALMAGEIGDKGGIKPEQLMRAVRNVVKGQVYYDKLFGYRPNQKWLDAFRRSIGDDPGLEKLAKEVAPRLNWAALDNAEFEIDYWLAGNTFPRGGLAAQESMDEAARRGFFSSPELKGAVAEIASEYAGENQDLVQKLVLLRQDLEGQFSAAEGLEARRLQSEIDFLNGKIGEVVALGDPDVPVAYGAGPRAEREEVLKETLVDVISSREWNRLQELDGLESLRINLRNIFPLDAVDEERYQQLRRKQSSRVDLDAGEEKEFNNLKKQRDQTKKSATVELTPHDILIYWSQDIEARKEAFDEKRADVVEGEIPVTAAEFTDLLDLYPRIEDLAGSVESIPDRKRLATAVLMAIAAQKGYYQPLYEMIRVLAKAEKQGLQDAAREVALGMDEEDRPAFLQQMDKSIADYLDPETPETEIPRRLSGLYQPVRQFPLLSQFPVGSREERSAHLARWLSMGIKSEDIRTWDAHTLVQFIGDDWRTCEFQPMPLVKEWQKMRAEVVKDIGEEGWDVFEKYADDLRKCAVRKVRVIQGQTLALKTPQAIQEALQAVLVEGPTEELEERVGELQEEKQRLERMLGERVAPEVTEIQEELALAQDGLRRAVENYERCLQENVSLEEQLEAEQQKVVATETVAERSEELAVASPEAAELVQVVERLERLARARSPGAQACFSSRDMDTLIDSLMLRKARNTLQQEQYQTLVKEQERLTFSELGYGEDLHAIQQQGQQLEELLRFIKQQGIESFVCPPGIVA